MNEERSGFGRSRRRGSGLFASGRFGGLSFPLQMSFTALSFFDFVVLLAHKTLLCDHNSFVYANYEVSPERVQYHFAVAHAARHFRLQNH
jgi:hypothetical protein